MKYVTFKDKSIYSKMKYTSIHRLMYETETHVAVELELLDKDSNWILTMPFEHQLLAWEELLKNNADEFFKLDKFIEFDDNTPKVLKFIPRETIKETLAFFAKYRKWQKRKLYTKQEFENLFEPL